MPCAPAQPHTSSRQSSLPLNLFGHDVAFEHMQEYTKPLHGAGHHQTLGEVGSVDACNTEQEQSHPRGLHGGSPSVQCVHSIYTIYCVQIPLLRC